MMWRPVVAPLSAIAIAFGAVSAQNAARIKAPPAKQMNVERTA